VQELQSLYSVAVAGSDNKLTVKTVKVGPRVGSEWIIESGLSAGERVVVEGAQRVRPGTVVTPKPAPAAGEGQAGTSVPRKGN
jgi:membrane fusion protein (multidrug efflux system)